MKLFLFSFALLLALLAAPAFAQAPDAQKLYTKLYCPLCGGVRLDVCELKVCEEMRAEIQQKLAAGESEQQIIQYYRVRWGDQVLGYPPTEGLNLVPWLIPFALVLGGGAVLWRMASHWTRRPHSAPTLRVSSDVEARIERELNEGDG
ncbi:MAG: cytochrome c-type biogenesis protein [Chloroflexota bacterium]